VQQLLVETLCPELDCSLSRISGHLFVNGFHTSPDLVDVKLGCLRPVLQVSRRRHIDVLVIKGEPEDGCPQSDDPKSASRTHAVIRKPATIHPIRIKPTSAKSKRSSSGRRKRICLGDNCLIGLLAAWKVCRGPTASRMVTVSSATQGQIGIS
jgi:hypothetical protein